MYPNPANEILYIENNSIKPDIVLITITDITGREIIHTKKRYCGLNTVDIRAIPDGIYFVTVESGESRMYLQLVIQ
ncbi:MAG: T9SS type A sorting domain-containing protein [Bacteroidetes bacterium]|nr:T9SS type A sorting domain-containing protein [Bacteroidota bacterium]